MKMYPTVLMPRIGAHTPMVAYVGSSPMPTVAPATVSGRTVARSVTESWVEVMSIAFGGANDCSGQVGDLCRLISVVAEVITSVHRALVTVRSVGIQAYRVVKHSCRQEW
ncbi:hypothetical protein C5613_17115 [Rhodococcus opacus]|uniref:Uncharacterized protein n=1 Tax=Rhodococcus opacus TaxID=37919 RepID=A0A2S8J9U8_RHOOP|nr:hypothetical protein C5613_17115 [Rhodococcus opacus]